MLAIMLRGPPPCFSIIYFFGKTTKVVPSSQSGTVRRRWPLRAQSLSRLRSLGLRSCSRTPPSPQTRWCRRGRLDSGSEKIYAEFPNKRMISKYLYFFTFSTACPNSNRTIVLSFGTVIFHLKIFFFLKKRKKGAIYTIVTLLQSFRCCSSSCWCSPPWRRGRKSWQGR